ncbi:MAG: hypothetical protein KC656_34625, partial [Myxococcales bacterium]|nr:hypothetical protein [Myxococcales bacterium]
MLAIEPHPVGSARISRLLGRPVGIEELDGIANSLNDTWDLPAGLRRYTLSELGSEERRELHQRSLDGAGRLQRLFHEVHLAADGAGLRALTERMLEELPQFLAWSGYAFALAHQLRAHLVAHPLIELVASLHRLDRQALAGRVAGPVEEAVWALTLLAHDSGPIPSIALERALVFARDRGLPWRYREWALFAVATADLELARPLFEALDAEHDVVGWLSAVFRPTTRDEDALTAQTGLLAATVNRAYATLVGVGDPLVALELLESLRGFTPAVPVVSNRCLALLRLGR